MFHELKFSGAEIMYVDAAKFFQQKGVTLFAMATGFNLGPYAKSFEEAGFKVFHRYYPGLRRFIAWLKFFQDFRKLVSKNKIDILHIHSARAMWGISLFSWILRLKVVYTFHNVFPTHWYTKIYHSLLRWSAKKVFGCKFQSISDSVYENELVRFHNRTTKIYNWYNPDRFFPAKIGEKETIRMELRISNDSTVLISVGGCSEIKRHSDIIKALPRIIEYIPNCVYLHLGEGETSKEEEILAEQLGVKGHIYFLGNQAAVRKYLLASDIYIMPSKFEGISLTTIEAMACFIPTILYNVPGLRDFKREEIVSEIIDEDYHAIISKVVELNSNKIQSGNLAARAAKYVNKTFSLELNCGKILELYCE